MRSLVCSSLTVMGLVAAVAPAMAQAQSSAPAGYASAAAMAAVAPAGSAPVAVMASRPAPDAASAQHKHKGLLRGRTVCVACAKKEEASMRVAGPMTEQVVACAHSRNGACPSCRALLAMPGVVTVGNAPAPGAPVEAPGRAMVSNTPANASAPGAVAAIYDPSMTPEPAPIGVMQANYAQNAGAMPAAASSIPSSASMRPGHAIAENMGASPAPFQHKPTSSMNPHIIGHLLGYSGIGADWREARSQRKNEAHASIPYNNEGTTVNELPASAVYGRR